MERKKEPFGSFLKNVLQFLSLPLAVETGDVVTAILSGIDFLCHLADFFPPGIGAVFFHRVEVKKSLLFGQNVLQAAAIFPALVAVGIKSAVFLEDEFGALFTLFRGEPV